MDEFTFLANTIKDAAKERRIVYVPNPGNYGDGLIRYATKLFFQDFDLRHIEINVGFRGGRFALTPFALNSGKYFIVYGGGGSWCKSYDFGRSICDYVGNLTSKYLVLPSSFELAPRNRSATYFSRDRQNSMSVLPQSLFCHDMAFYLAARKKLPFGDCAPHEDTGYFYRTDHEASPDRPELPYGNIDVSTLGDHMSDMQMFFETIARYKHIKTDRLHVCIAAALLGRGVALRSGSYFKIADIYNSSINQIFSDNVLLEDVRAPII